MIVGGYTAINLCAM